MIRREYTKSKTSVFNVNVTKLLITVFPWRKEHKQRYMLRELAIDNARNKLHTCLVFNLPFCLRPILHCLITTMFFYKIILNGFGQPFQNMVKFSRYNKDALQAILRERLTTTTSITKHKKEKYENMICNCSVYLG